MIKVMLNTTTNVDTKTILSDPEIESCMSYNNSDYIISQSTIHPYQSLNKTIYLANEPPLADHRHFCYAHFDDFNTVICHNPDKNKENQFPYTLSGEVQFYPVRADPFEMIEREDTTLRRRAVFYAGMRGFYEGQPDVFGAINITPLRTVLGEYFLKEFPGSIIIGRGWSGQVDKIEQGWRIDKLNKIRESECDFVLALENMMYQNYLYEKVWDGICSDRVTLYLGDINVEKHIPLNCFIDLRPYFDTKTKHFDTEALGKRLREITQEEYDSILKNAREFFKQAKGKYRYYSIELAKFILRRIKEDYANKMGKKG